MDSKAVNESTTAADDSLSATVEQSIARIVSVYELLPGFVPAPAEGLRPLVVAHVVPDDFIEAAAVSIERDERLRTATSLQPAEARRVISRSLRFEPLAAAAEALARDIRFNMFREREEVAQAALQVYRFAKDYARRPRGAGLVSHVRTMRATLGRTGIPRKAKTPTA